MGEQKEEDILLFIYLFNRCSVPRTVLSNGNTTYEQGYRNLYSAEGDRK